MQPTEQRRDAGDLRQTASPLRYEALKRAIDMVGAGILIVLITPLLLACLVVVWLDCGRPLIYRRHVLGRSGRCFAAFKIRTMVPQADRIIETDRILRRRYTVTNKIANDPRLTRSGCWLRRLSLDELPQLLNVIRGEMSLVGPRMITAGELQEWGETAELMLRVRPGLTGLWQVSGRQTLRKSDRVRLDGDYVRRMSLGLDLVILARTVPAVLSRRGAY